MATDLIARARARDPVQETLLAGWRGLRGFEQRSSLRTWLYRIATSFGLPRSPPG